jgi:hypothetical protein
MQFLLESDNHGNCQFNTWGREMARQQSTLERVFSLIAAAAVISLIGYVIIRNEKFADPNLVVMARVVMALSVAVFGATVPGFLNVSWSGSGLAVRAGGALALFVLSLFWTPKVEKSEMAPTISQTTNGPNSPAVANTGPVVINNNPTAK